MYMYVFTIVIAIRPFAFVRLHNYLRFLVYASIGIKFLLLEHRNSPIIQRSDFIFYLHRLVLRQSGGTLIENLKLSIQYVVFTTLLNN
jgi:hypothetical protein